MIKTKIAERLAFVADMMKEATEAHRSGNTYHAACLVASARDSLEALTYRVNDMARALGEAGYDNTYFADLASRCARTRNMTVARLESLETSLKG